MPQLTLAQKEQIARQNGFPSYEAMILWQNQRNQQSGGTVAIKGASAPPSEGQPAPPQGAMSWHPANILKYIGDVLGASRR